MTERDIDFEFDFFDEPETREAPEAERPRLVRRGGPRPPLRTPTGFTPLLRLVVAISVAILVVVLLVFWVQSCQGASKKRTYRNYIEDVTEVGSRSQAVGRSFSQLLTTPGLRQGALESRLNGFTQQQTIILAQAQKLSPPGRLRAEHQHVLEALQYRLSGLAGFRDTLARTVTVKSKERAGALLANQARRFIASDVVWQDGFKVPTKQVLRDEGVGGVAAVPGSKFLTNADLVTTSSLASVWQRLHGAATGGQPGGLRGMRLVSVKVLPSGETLTPGGEAIIKLSTSLAFEVTVEDSGNAQEVRVPVVLTIEKKPGPPIVKRATVNVIDPGETKTVRFTDIGEPDFAPRTMKVEVKPVPGEARKDNNVATFTVTFTV